MFSLWSTDNKAVVCGLMDTHALTHTEWTIVFSAPWYSEGHSWIGAGQRRERRWVREEANKERKNGRRKNGWRRKDAHHRKDDMK